MSTKKKKRSEIAAGARRSWRYNVRGIAEAAGVGIRVARRAKGGEYAAGELRSVARWVVARLLEDVRC